MRNQARYLTKPFPDIEALEAVIERALVLDRAYREISNLQHSLEGAQAGSAMIGRSTAIDHLTHQVHQVALLDTTTLLGQQREAAQADRVGESGEDAGYVFHRKNMP